MKGKTLGQDYKSFLCTGCCNVSATGVGRGAGRRLPPWIFKLLAKKDVFSISRGKKRISPLLAPLEKIL